MKEAMSNIDIRVIMSEFEELTGCFIKNIYQYDNVFVLKLYQPRKGTFQLLIEPGCRIHLTEFRRVAPRNPPQFVVVLRKYLREKKIRSIQQHDLDRIVVIEIECETKTLKLVAELFGNGNILLLDEQNRVFVAQKYKKMRDRNIVPKAIYKFPPPRGIDVLGKNVPHLESIIAGSDASVVRTLASRLNLDALSCEEICAMAGITPTTKVNELKNDDFNRLTNSVDKFRQKLEQGIKEPRIVYEENREGEREDLAFIPFDFKLFENKQVQIFETYSNAIDEYFGGRREEIEKKTQQGLSKEQQRLLRIIEKQQERIEVLQDEAAVARRKGELIYANFQIVQDILQTVAQARSEGITWEEIIKKIHEGKKKGNPVANCIKTIIPTQGKVIVCLDGEDITLDIRNSAQENASIAFEYAKKAELKIEGAKRQIEKTKAKLESFVEEEFEEHQPKVRRIRKRKWYEKFRWFVSSEGFLVLGGRDVKSNEQLAKRYMEPNDVFLHAALHGAPYTVIKVPGEAPTEQTLREAAQFAVSFSRAWQDGFSAGDAYWVYPEQVSFTPPSGEYLPAGGIMIYGVKNYIRKVPVMLAVGVVFEDKEVIPVSGPPSAISAHTKFYVIVVPGNAKKSLLAKDILHTLRKMVPDKYTSLIDDIPIEDMMRILPPGNGKILSRGEQIV